MEFRRTQEGAPTDYETWYNSGLTHHERGEWMKAHNCFKQAEITILNEIGDYFKNNERIETANEYFKRARKASNKLLKLAPPGSNWLTNFLAITGMIAVVCAILTIMFWPGIPGWAALLPLIILLFDLLVFIILLPLAIVKHVTNRRKSLLKFHSELDRIENKITNLINAVNLTEFQKWFQIGKLKVKRARMAMEIARYEYSASFEERT